MMNKEIEEYITNFPIDQQSLLNEIYYLICEVLPKQASEKIAWGMPTFVLNDNLVHFSGQKRHIGFHVGHNPIVYFARELKVYKTSKGTIQFNYNQPLPKELIKEIVKFRVKENMEEK